MAGRRLLPIVALLAGLAFTGGLVRLFAQRFAVGDVYPPYSSLRADPLGTKALFDTLAEVGREPRRTFRLAPEVPDRPVTLLYLGLPSGLLGGADLRAVEAVEQVARSGGRVVLCLRGPRQRTGSGTSAPAEGESEPALAPEPDPEPDPQPEPAAGEDGEPAPGEEDAEPAPPWEAGRDAVDLGKRWGFDVEPQSSNPSDWSDLSDSSDSPDSSGLSVGLRWYSSLAFAGLDDAWHPVLSRQGRVLVAERSFGEGTLVLCADSYPVSNEALWRDRAPAFLAWLLGTAPVVLFDEAHLGVVEAPGVASVARDLGLQGALPALAVLFLLFAWQRGSALGSPAAGSGAGASRGETEDVASGLAGLLRRSVPPRELLAVCLQEWERVGAPTGSGGEALRAQVRAAVKESGERRPVETYRAAARLVVGRRGLRPEEPDGETPPAGGPEKGETR